MSDTLITVVAIIVAAGLIFVVPLVTMADRFDTTAQAEVEAIVADFVDEIRSTGKITQAKYDKFLQNLDAQGYVFGVEMEVKNIDENPGKKSIQTERDKIGENVYYSEYTTQIMQELEDNGAKNLKQGSIVVVTVRNENLTFTQQMKQFMYRIVGNDTVSIVASKAGMVQ
ncbi:MAG: hypothetical protein HFJ59_06880 [Clostridia bacterium]|nr:hypothetical protein [Clostridia bacterium]